MDRTVGSPSSNIISSTQDASFVSSYRYQCNHDQNNSCENNPLPNHYFDSTPSTTVSVQSIHRTATLRPHSTPATLIWLEDNYELAEGVCIPRSVLYMHYVDFCANNHVQPVNAASFGKIIRQQFPQLTTRRLGTRGQSRYHYYGIAIRETSSYYQSCYSKKSGQNNVDPLKREARDNIAKQPISPVINSRIRTTTMLPSFPNIKEICLPTDLDKNKISTFLMMYRTHCQRILDTIIRANFDEVQTFLLHFWQGVPPHLSPILECNSVVNLIGVCDSILYKTIANVLLPSVIQALPESVTKIMRQFATELDAWLKMSLFNLPDALRTMKLELARRFEQVIKRQTSLNHLSQASRMVVNNNEITLQMLRDWRLIDVQGICREILYENNSGRLDEDRRDVCTVADMVRNFCQQFERLLEDEVQIESYLEWLESMVHKCVLFPRFTSNTTIKRLSRRFLLLWSAFGSRVIREMTLHSAPSFGSFHLLRLMFDDYVLYLLEYVQIDEQMKQFINQIPNNEPPIFTIPYFNDSEVSSQTSSPNGEYDMVGSSTGDFGDSPSQSVVVACGDCSAHESIGGPANQNANFCLYQPNFQYQSSTYNQHVDQHQSRSTANYSWYSSFPISAYEYGEQQSQSSGQSSQLIIASTVDDQLAELSSVGYSADTSAMIGYGNDYDRQVYSAV